MTNTTETTTTEQAKKQRQSNKRDLSKVYVIEQCIADVAATGVARNFSDTGCANLTLRVTPEGATTWHMFYTSRLTKQTKGPKVGAWPELSYAGEGGAREQVNDARKIVERGTEEPVFATTAKKNETDGMTVNAAFALFDAEHITPNLVQANDQRNMLTKFIRESKFGSKPLASLTRVMIREQLERVKTTGGKDGKGTPKTAHNLQSAFSGFLTFAADKGIIPANVIAGTKAIVGKGVESTRVLSDDEIKTFWHAVTHVEEFNRRQDERNAAHLHQDEADALVLILTSASRQGMIRVLTGDHFKNRNASSMIGHNGGPRLRKIDDTDGRPYLDHHQDDMKMGHAFAQPLNPYAVAIIERRLADNDGYLFPTRSTRIEDKGKHMSEGALAEACALLCEAFGWTKEGEKVGCWFTPHDLRRTASAWVMNTVPAHLQIAGSTAARVYKVADTDLLLAHRVGGGAYNGKGKTKITIDNPARFDDFLFVREMSDWLYAVLKHIIEGADADAVFAEVNGQQRAVAGIRLAA